MSIKLEAFEKSARLLTSAEFQRIFKDAVKSSDRFFAIFGRSNDLKLARLGLAISRKCSRRAVDRNRIKRLARETFRTSKLDLSGIDFVVICRPCAVGSNNQLLTSSLSEHFTKVRFRLCGSS